MGTGTGETDSLAGGAALHRFDRTLERTNALTAPYSNYVYVRKSVGIGGSGRPHASADVSCLMDATLLTALLEGPTSKL